MPTYRVSKTSRRISPRSSKKKDAIQIKLEAELPLLDIHKTVEEDVKKTELLSPVSRAFDLFPQHTATFKSLHQDFRAREWYPIEDIPNHVRSLNLNVPVLIPAAKCWKEGESPSVQEILAYLVDSKVQPPIEAKGKNKRLHTLGNVISQLLMPPAEDSMVAHNIPADGFGTLDHTAIPSQFPLPAGDIDYSMNVTPANTIVDIHIDQGTNGLSIGLGRASDPPYLRVHKLWFLWPPTTHNLQLYEKLRGPKFKKGLRLLKSQDLEHGVVASAGTEHGIFLPAGWLHATITTASGFLPGITFSSTATIGMCSKLMAIDTRLFPSSFDNILPTYMDALKETVNSGDDDAIRAAAKGWIGVEQALEKIGFKVGQHRSACKKLLDVWKSVQFVDRPGQKCACGWMGTSCGKHFWTKHLRIVTPERYKVPCDG